MADAWHFTDLGIVALQEAALGAGVRVAVLDSGVSPIRGAFGALRGLGSDGSPEAPSDANGHGTSCASLIASQLPDAPGIAPGVEMISIRVTASDLPVERRVREAFATAMQAGCHVISCSFTLADPVAATLDAVREASRRGIVVVAAAGNDPLVASGFPERTPNVLVVGPYDAERRPTPARAGLFTDVLAPGDELPALSRDGSVREFGRSSAAAAVVSGVAALVLSATPAAERRRVALALEGLVRATATPASELSFLNPTALLKAARNLP